MLILLYFTYAKKNLHFIKNGKDSLKAVNCFAVNTDLNNKGRKA